MDRVILRAFCSNDNFNYGANYAYICLDENYIKLLLRRMETVAYFAAQWRPSADDDNPVALGSLYYVSFWEYAAFFFEGPKQDGDLVEFSDLYGEETANKRRGHFLEPEQVAPPEYETISFDVDTIRVLPNEVYWDAMPKESGDHVYTDRITREDLKEYGYQLSLRGKPNPTKEKPHGRRGKASRRRKSAGS